MSRSTTAIIAVVIGVFLLIVVAPLGSSFYGQLTQGGDTQQNSPERTAGTPSTVSEATGSNGESTTSTDKSVQMTDDGRTPSPVDGTDATDTPRSDAPSTPTSAPTGTTTPPAPTLDINRTLLSREILDEINTYRANSGYSTLRTRGNLVDDIAVMANNHTETLREDGRAWSIPAEYDMKGLYEAHDLYRTCKFMGDGDFVINADDGKLMAVQKIDASSEDESRIAERVVDNWVDDRYHGEKFDYENAERVGVGFAIDSRTEHAYIAISMC